MAKCRTRQDGRWPVTGRHATDTSPPLSGQNATYARSNIAFDEHDKRAHWPGGRVACISDSRALLCCESLPYLLVVYPTTADNYFAPKSGKMPPTQPVLKGARP